MPTKKRHEYIIGVDLGGTNIVVGAMSADGKHHHAMRSIPTSAEMGAEGVADRIVGLIEGVILDTIAQTKAQRRDFIGVGIGAPGPLDREKGIVIVAPNLGWRNFPLRDRIGERLNLPATLDNDANCATVGEWWQGAAKGATNVIGMTIGTGIGGGLILDGKLFHGSSDVAGEIGHTTIDLNGRHCKCGNYGCLEAYASGPAIATRAREVLVREETASLLPSLVD
jgi:glucokinase